METAVSDLRQLRSDQIPTGFMPTNYDEVLDESSNRFCLSPVSKYSDSLQFADTLGFEEIVKSRCISSDNPRTSAAVEEAPRRFQQNSVFLSPLPQNEENDADLQISSSQNRNEVLPSLFLSSQSQSAAANFPACSTTQINDGFISVGHDENASSFIPTSSKLLPHQTTMVLVKESAKKADKLNWRSPGVSSPILHNEYPSFENENNQQCATDCSTISKQGENDFDCHSKPCRASVVGGGAVPTSHYHSASSSSLVCSEKSPLRPVLVEKVPPLSQLSRLMRNSDSNTNLTAGCFDAQGADGEVDFQVANTSIATSPNMNFCMKAGSTQLFKSAFCSSSSSLTSCNDLKDNEELLRGEDYMISRNSNMQSHSSLSSYSPSCRDRVEKNCQLRLKSLSDGKKNILNECDISSQLFAMKKGFSANFTTLPSNSSHEKGFFVYEN
eukprot:GDKJ01038509.1.p1 GENE.GDKJ01038509.1~~GDKJ01038509.1.p1  ORF type:complete len:458 (-),score=117.24 GDKJ01038509.1:203-1528(-)